MPTPATHPMPVSLTGVRLTAALGIHRLAHAA